LSIARKLLIGLLGVLAALGLLAQCAFEAGVVMWGVPMTKLFQLYFAWQMVSSVLILMAAGLCMSTRLRLLTTALVIATLTAIGPIYQAFHVALHGHLEVWVSGFRNWPGNTAYRLAISFLPAVFTIALALVAYRRYKAQTFRSQTPWPQ
jgi:hypothetical protein